LEASFILKSYDFITRQNIHQTIFKKQNTDINPFRNNPSAMKYQRLEDTAKIIPANDKTLNTLTIRSLFTFGPRTTKK